MADFDPAIRALLDGRTVRIAELVAFDFLSGMVRVWNGAGQIVVGGSLWGGLRGYANATVGNAGPGQAAEEWTYQLAAAPDVLAKFSEDRNESVDREVFDYFQFFDEHWQPLGELLQWRWGIMGPLTVQRPIVKAGDPPVRILSVTAQNAFTNRKRPANAFYSHLDQQARSAGDNLCLAMSSVNVPIAWPKFT